METIMLDNEKIIITEEMVMRGLELFADTKVSDVATETSKPAWRSAYRPRTTSSCAG